MRAWLEWLEWVAFYGLTFGLALAFWWAVAQVCFILINGTV